MRRELRALIGFVLLPLLALTAGAKWLEDARWFGTERSEEVEDGLPEGLPRLVEGQTQFGSPAASLRFSIDQIASFHLATQQASGARKQAGSDGRQIGPGGCDDSDPDRYDRSHVPAGGEHVAETFLVRGPPSAS